MRKFYTFFFLFCGLSFMVHSHLSAQSNPCDSLFSPCNDTYSRNGFYFDIFPTSNVLIESFATMSQNGGARDMEIYYKVGSHLGSETNVAAWTLAGSYSGFNPTGAISCPIPVEEVPIPVNVCLTGGQTYSFYIIKTSGSGSFEGAYNVPTNTVVAYDGILALYAGSASGASAFSSTGLFDSAAFQGSIRYSCGCSGAGLANPATGNGLSASPVPSNDVVDLVTAYEVKNAMVDVYDAFGRLIYSSFINRISGTSPLQIDVSAWTPGIYISVIRDPERQAAALTTRFVRE